MSLPRIIFVDGLPGSGKSTTAQRLALHLRRQGHAARWIFEHEHPHPVFAEPAVRALREQPAGTTTPLFEEALAGYARLTNDLSNTHVLEGCLFQTAAGTQLLTDTSMAAIHAFFDQTLEVTGPAQPVLIHLRAPDVARALATTAARRGEWFPEYLTNHLGATPRGRRLGVSDWPGAITLLQQHRDLCDTLAERFPGPVLTLDPSDGDWDRCNAQLTTFLNLPPLIEPTTSPACELAQLAGTYRAEGTTDTMTFTVTPEGLAVSAPQAARLWQRPEGGFEIEGIGVELNFITTPGQPASAVHCGPRLAQLPLVWQRV